jgi:hypothetical protein
MIAALLTALVLVPNLSVSGKELHWTPSGNGGYRVQEQVGGQRMGAIRVEGTSYTPEARPGMTVSYRVRTVPDGEWSNSVSIAFPSRSKGSGGEEPPPEEPKTEPPPKEKHERPKKGGEGPEVEPPGGEPPVEEPPVEEPPVEEPPVEEPPVEEPPLEEPAGGFFVGLNAGYWGASEPPDLRKLASVVRLDTPPKLTPWESAGLRVIADEAGPYSKEGVSGLNHAAYVTRVVEFVRANPHVLAIEVLNEPGGSWFWGSQSESAANRESYARLLIEVHQALVANFGAKRPLELASWDGGHDSSNAWGEAWSHNATALADVDGVTSHPYGGTGSRASAILGNRRLVESAHAASHKPVYITEVGFPTKGPTGDSLQYTELEQATAVFNFALWARSTGYVAGVTFYGYRDGTEGGGYGVETHAGVKKLAFTALQELHESLPCTICM